MGGSIKEKAFQLFDKLQPGEVMIISKVARKDPEAFRQYAKEYIDQGGFIEFDKDYRKLKGLERIDWKKLKREYEQKNHYSQPNHPNLPGSMREGKTTELRSLPAAVSEPERRSGV